MRFVVDAQLPPALARLLESHGHQAEDVADIDLRDAADSPIWLHAIENEAILVTKDADFAHRFRQGGSAPVILWLRIGNTSRRALLQYFIPLLPRIEAMIRQGERLIEVR